MKILFVCGYGKSPVRIYRGEGVLNRLRKIDPTVELVHLTKEPWIDMLSVDVMYFMRSNQQMELNLAEDALAMNIPVWYDIDDDMFEIPRENPASSNMGNPQKAVTLWFLNNADVVTVSTKHLADRIKTYCPDQPNIVHVPNALDDYAFPNYDEYPDDDPEEPIQRILSWRGGVTHQGDIFSFAKQFWDFLENTKFPRLNFIGYDPWYLEKGVEWAPAPQDFSKRINFTPYDFDYYAYMNYFRQLKPWAHCVPLIDNHFNRSKSNIALLEAVYAGAIPIVPDWKEWDYPGATHYTAIDDFKRALMSGIGWAKAEKRRLWQQNVDHLKKHQILSVVNKKRLAVLKSLVAQKAVVA